MQVLYSVAQCNVSVCQYIASSQRDLRLLLDILQGQARVHCHASVHLHLVSAGVGCSV